MKVFCLTLIGITLRINLVLISLCFAGNCIAQQSHGNKSLNAVIKSSNNSKDKVDALVKQAYTLIHHDPKLAEKYSNQAISISNKINYDKGVASAMLNLAKIYRENGRSLQLSMEYTIQAVHIFEQIKDKKGLAQAYFELGYIHKDISNYEKSIDNFTKSLNFYKQLKEESNVSLCRLVMGHVNVDKGMKEKDSSYYKRAFVLYTKVHDYRKKTNEPERRASALTSLANLYLEYFKLSPKPSYLYMSIDYSTESIKCYNEPGITSVNILNLGEANYGLKQNEKALSYYLKALKLAESNGDPQMVLQTINKIIQVEKEFKHYDEIFAYSRKFVAVAQKNRLRLELKTHYQLLSEVYLTRKDYENAYKYRLLYEKYSDSILNEEKAKALVKFQVEFESEKKDKEINLLNKNQQLQNEQLNQQQMTRNYLIATIALICFLLVVSYSRFVVKRKAHHLIQEKNLELEKLSIVARETATGVMITSASGEIEWFNEGFSKLFKWDSIEEYKAKKGSNIYAVSGNDSIKEIIQAAVNQRKSITYENLMSPKTGNDLWIQTTLTPIFDKEGNLVRMLFVEMDVTELNSAKETAELALEIQEQFLANTSHEIRTPMNGIMGIVRHLKETPLTSEQESYLDIIGESSSNLLHVVNDILDISKIRAGKIVFESTEFRLSELFNALRVTQLFRSDEKGIYLKSFIDPEIPEVLLGDPIRLNQILLNLIGNAIKFTDSGGVLFSARKIDSIDKKVIVEFSVEDTGIGIANDKLDYVFESFAQADSHINRRYGGTGLGLSISKSMIEQQNGTLSIESELNKGSKLTFTLEFEEGDPNWNGTTLQSVDGIPANVDLSDLAILLVEDNQINQMVALFELKKWKADADVAESAVEAFEAMEKKNYDLILMDISMPGMDGLEATRHIRNGSKQKDIPIIAMTASALVGEKDRCFQIGMNDYISKPFYPVDLYRKIVKWGRSQTLELEDLPNGILEKAKADRVVDLEMIYDRAAGNIEYVKEMIELFRKEMPVYLAEMEDAMSKSDTEMVKRIAHKMLSPSAFFGANDLCVTLREMEKKVDLSPDEIKLLVQQVNQKCLTVFEELKKELDAIG